VTFLKIVLRSSVLILIMTLLCSIVYPGAVFTVSQLLFPHKANGSFITNKSNQIIGSSLLGQKFSSERYFHSRPSYAGKEGYNPSDSSGSNMSVNSKDYYRLVAQRVEEYRRVNELPLNESVPMDAVTASASGLDPHISLKNAFLQIKRVAKARGITEGGIYQIIENNRQGTILGVFGEKRVNVLLLNLDLDQLASAH
jgi:K+-transporting ATPase ATPase C chain